MKKLTTVCLLGAGIVLAATPASARWFYPHHHYHSQYFWHSLKQVKHYPNPVARSGSVASDERYGIGRN